jgi:hypothetical protein
MTSKLALRKYLENEKKKLDTIEKNIDQKWENERRKFYDHYSEQIKHLQSFDPSSKLLELLEEDKIKNLEEILNKMFEATNLTNIDSLIDYFIKCTKEFKNFEDFIGNITTKVAELEKEVYELEFIINFCERNLEAKNETNDKNFDESEMLLMNELKNAGENFVHLQYQVILRVYKKYCEEVYTLIKKIDNASEEELNYFDEKDNIETSSVDIPQAKSEVKEDFFFKYIQTHLLAVQDRLKEAHILMKEKRSIASVIPANKNSNPRMTLIGEIDFSEVDNRFGLKSEKIKDSVRKEFDRPGDKGTRMINLTKMKGILDPVINDENK